MQPNTEEYENVAEFMKAKKAACDAAELKRIKDQRREIQKRYYQRNKEKICAKALERYYEARSGSPTKPRGRQMGTLFPNGYKKTETINE